jgi:uncharacterized membrane protein HdeD (DUF308 family)
MASLLARMWWVVVLRGVLAIIFGIMAFTWTAEWWAAIVIVFGVYAIFDGVGALVAAVRGEPNLGPRWELLLEGVVGIAAGLVAIAWPGITELVLLYMIAGWAIATGVLAIASAIRLRKEIRGEWALGLSGVLSIALGLGLILLPGPGLLVIAWWVGATSLVFGFLLLMLGLRLRKVSKAAELKPT